jgi:hypothetical protein
MPAECKHTKAKVIRRFDCEMCFGIVVWCPECGAWCEHDEYKHEEPEKWEWELPSHESQA